MIAPPSIPAPEPHQAVDPNLPVLEPDPELTPAAEAAAANKLPRAEAEKKFEADLEAHDPGNQPA